jgi:GH43 family beta-xylosidase
MNRLGSFEFFQAAPAARWFRIPHQSALRSKCCVLLSAVVAASMSLPAAAADTTQTVQSFTNPAFPGTGQDPSILRWGDNYYLVQSHGGSIRVFKSPTLTGLRDAKGVPVWWIFKDGSDLNDLWAPELVQLDGKFYIYVAAAHRGVHTSRRMYVLEASNPQGPYVFKGKIADSEDRWAIDGSVLEQDGKRYFVWSGWRGDQPEHGQNLYIAPMANPWTIVGQRKLLSSPSRDWERIGREPINEGPETIYHDGRLFLVYSASHSMTDDYCLGLLTYKGNGNVTDRKSWTKSNGCVFAKNVAGGVYGPGHDTITVSPDGRETWNVYHATAVSGCGWSCRTIRMQRLNWRADGTPDFGVPIPLSQAIPIPSGEGSGAASPQANAATNDARQTGTVAR